MIRPVVIPILLFSASTVALSQEIVTGLLVNQPVNREWEKSDRRKSIAAADTLELPFFDDFSGTSLFPDNKKWQDKNVFINNTYSVKQKTTGIATFDALDLSGRLYETATPAGFVADHLTSQPVNLNLLPAEDVYLSFFYEPGGIADMPEAKDSLTLQFYAPLEAKWYSVWCSPQILQDTFRAVNIPINQPRYLKKGFRFRFINYASLSPSSGDPSMSGNCDQWNIDYVLLNKNRNPADTIPVDVAFTRPVRSMLKTYETMPWKQFRQVYLSEMGPWITINYRNNDLITRNVTRNFEIFDVYKNIVAHSFSAGAANISASSDLTYNAVLLYTFNSDNQDSALFRVKCSLITDAFDPKQNDTTVYFQRFGKYFSFDDGTSEAGYGVNGLGSRNAMVAYRFKSFIADTLRAVQICFNDSYENANQRAFDLMVWEDNAGLPGNVLYTQEEMMVSPGSGNNGFYTYVLNDPLEVTGNFYVGWRQRSETFLNAGFDLNTLHNDRQLYWLNGDWNISQARGSLMIRPLFGPRISPTSVVNQDAGNKNLKIFPNPASERITIVTGDLSLTGDVKVKVTDLQGREIVNTMLDDQLDISGLSPGMYFVAVTVNNKPAGFARLIKSYR